MRYDAATLSYEPIELFGKQMLFTCARIDPASVPKGYYRYDIRHDDECGGDPVEVARFVLINHWGTVITNEPLPLQEGVPMWIDPEKDWNYLGYEMSLDDYMADNPPHRERDPER